MAAEKTLEKAARNTVRNATVDSEASSQVTAFDTKATARLLRHLDFRLIPLVSLLYLYDLLICMVV